MDKSDENNVPQTVQDEQRSVPSKAASINCDVATEHLRRDLSSSESVFMSSPSLPPMTSSCPGAMTAREFAQSVECWLWQRQCWTQQMNWMTWMYYSMPLMAAVSATSPPTVLLTSANGTRPNVIPASFQQIVHPQQQHPAVVVGRDCRIASISRRLTAEFIDFMIVFSVKLLVSLIAIDYGFNWFQVATDAEFERLLSMTWNANLAIAITTELLIVEFINRVFICLFETICLWKLGATPGKRMMGVYVVSCEELLPLPGGRVRVLPARHLGFFNALIRATIKNFSVAFFFPVCLTIFFFQHNRTMYDIVSSSIVIEIPDDVLFPVRRRQQ